MHVQPHRTQVLDEVFKGAHVEGKPKVSPSAAAPTEVTAADCLPGAVTAGVAAGSCILTVRSPAGTAITFGCCFLATHKMKHPRQLQRHATVALPQGKKIPVPA